MDRSMWRDLLEEALNLSSARLLDDDEISKNLKFSTEID